MTLKHILHTIVFILIVLIGTAQEPSKITGKVTDSKTGKPMAFVNIGIEGTLIGTASDTDGYFELNIPADYHDQKMYFSTVGYELIRMQISSLGGGDMNTIRLKEETYNLEGVEINTRSLVLYKMVRDVIDGIPTNYPSEGFTMNCIYKQEQEGVDTIVRHRNALVAIFDSSGYQSGKNAYEARHYRFENVYRNFDVKRLQDGVTFMDELLEFDIVRCQSMVLDAGYLNEYDLVLVEETVFQNDSVWVIAYKHARPTFSQTGDYYGERISGELTISKSLGVVLKNELEISSSNRSRLGRSSATDSINGECTYNVVATYTLKESKYVVENISMRIDNTGVKTNVALNLIEWKKGNKMQISGRQYYEKQISDPDFNNSL